MWVRLDIVVFRFRYIRNAVLAWRRVPASCRMASRCSFSPGILSRRSASFFHRYVVFHTEFCLLFIRNLVITGNVDLPVSRSIVANRCTVTLFVRIRTAKCSLTAGKVSGAADVSNGLSVTVTFIRVWGIKLGESISRGWSYFWLNFIPQYVIVWGLNSKWYTLHTSPLHANEGSALQFRLCPHRFPWTRGWVGLRVVLDVMTEEKSQHPHFHL